MESGGKEIPKLGLKINIFEIGGKIMVVFSRQIRVSGVKIHIPTTKFHVSSITIRRDDSSYQITQ